MPKANKGGWKTCTRGHKYRGPDPCPVCYPASRSTARPKSGARKRRKA
jgi:hypothetical protein